MLNSKGIVIDILFEQEQKTEVREGSLSLDKVPVAVSYTHLSQECIGYGKTIMMQI